MWSKADVVGANASQTKPKPPPESNTSTSHPSQSPKQNGRSNLSTVVKPESEQESDNASEHSRFSDSEDD